MLRSKLRFEERGEVMAGPDGTQENVPKDSRGDSRGSFEHRWSAYYAAVEGRPPRETLLAALQAFEAEGQVGGQAVDLGCGDGRDTVELVRRWWRVLAIDGEAEAIARLQQRPTLAPFMPASADLETRVQRFEDLVLPSAVDLINASFCLPFCPPDRFATLWGQVVGALRPGGRFCGHLFGDRDAWATYPDLSTHSRSQVEALLTPFTLELLDEEEHPGKTALGESKHWHLFNIVARKR